MNTVEFDRSPCKRLRDSSSLLARACSSAVATMGGASIMDRAVPRMASVADRPGLTAGDRVDLVLSVNQSY